MTTRLSNAITMQTRNSGSSCDNERTSRFRTATTRQSVRSVSVSMRPLAKSLWTLAVITALLVQTAERWWQSRRTGKNERMQIRVVASTQSFKYQYKYQYQYPCLKYQYFGSKYQYQYHCTSTCSQYHCCCVI